MRNQHVSIGVIDHPDKDTVATKLLIDLLQGASAGAWYAYYNLSPEGKHTVREIHVSIHMASDGVTPEKMIGKIAMKSTGETGSWENQGDFSILSIAAKDLLSFRDEVSETVRATFKQVIRKEQENRRKERLALARLEIHSPGNPFPS